MMPFVLWFLGCSYLYTVSYTAIVPADAVGAVVFTLHADDDPPQSTSLEIIATQRVYQASFQTCCSPEPSVHIGAYIDLDSDGTRDPDEPSYAHPTNPVTLTTQVLPVSINFAASAK